MGHPKTSRSLIDAIVPLESLLPNNSLEQPAPDGRSIGAAAQLDC